MNSKINLLYGFLLGLVIPAAMVGLFYVVFMMFKMPFTDNVPASIILLGGGINLLIMRRNFQKNREYLARGIMVSTFCCFIFYLFRFVTDL